MNVGEFIKQKRLENNYTLEQLGKRVGVSKMTVLRWESGEIKNIKSDKIEKLADALKVPVISLFNGFDADNSKLDIDEITPKEFSDKVKCLLSKTVGLTQQQKDVLLTTLNYICSDN